MLTIISFFQKLIKRGGGVGTRAGGWGNFSKIDKRGGGTIIRYSRVSSNFLYPENLLDKYLPRSCFSRYNMRNSQDLQLPRCRTDIFKKSFHYASLKAWNDTPSRVRELPTLSRFKQQLKLI